MDRPLPRARWYRRALLPALGVFAVVGLIALSLTARTGNSVRMAVTSFSIAEVRPEVFHDFVPLRARVVPRDIVFLDAQEGGRIERVLAQAGDTVTAGEPLIEFGNTELQLEVIEREVRLIEQINNLRSTELTLEQDRAANERSRADIRYQLVRLTRLTERRNSLARQGALSAADREDAADQLAYYQSLKPVVEETSGRQEEWRERRLPEIHDELTKLKENLVIVRGKLDNLIVRAPLAGRLTEMDLKVGQSCARGSRLAQITPDTGFKLAAEVDEFYLARVRIGQRADVELDDRTVPATVSKLYPQVKDGQFTIDLELGSAPAGLLAGQAAQGKLRLGEDRSALVLPAGAFLELTGGDWVFVLAPDGHSATRRRIHIGRRNAEQLEVTGGLAAHERVIVSDYRGLARIERIDLTPG
jgi:HlyD family secretion protein